MTQFKLCDTVQCVVPERQAKVMKFCERYVSISFWNAQSTGPHGDRWICAVEFMPISYIFRHYSHLQFLILSPLSLGWKTYSGNISRKVVKCWCFLDLEWLGVKVQLYYDQKKSQGKLILISWYIFFKSYGITSHKYLLYHY